MKLVAFVISAFLAVPAYAEDQQVLNPPGGPVYVTVDHQPGRIDRVENEQRRMKNKQLRRALMDQFDMNGDGKLGPRERMRAVRVLEKIQHKLAGRAGREGRAGAQGQRGQRGQRPKMQRFIERFDTNGDGNVDRSEMPPGAAKKLRRFDRDRDGWVEPNEAR